MTPTERTTGRQLDAPMAQLLSLTTAVVASLGLLLGCGQGAAQDAPEHNESTDRRYSSVEDTALRSALEQVREATEKFEDVEVAREAGYIRDPMNLCYGATDAGKPTQLGHMGVHYLRPEVLGITQEKPRVDGTGTHTDFTEPGVLVYEPRPDGSMELVAVENLVFKEAWDEAHDGPPTFHGLEYYPMVDNPRTEIDEAHHFRPHYELHLWVHRKNPIAVYSEWNPNVTCEHHERRETAAGTESEATQTAYAGIGREHLPDYWQEGDAWAEQLPTDWTRE